MILLTVLTIPTLVALGFYLFSGKKITLGEFAIQNVAQLILLSSVVLFSGFGDSSDTEIWNGRVTKKYSERVSCEHSYSCNCRTVSCGKDCSTTVCDTCYEHFYDVDWVVKTTNNERIEINRVNRQGTQEPPRFTSAKIGEPTSVTHYYTNYIKASPDSLFRKQGLVEKYSASIPPYPKVFDYYKTNRTYSINGASIPELAFWDNDLTEMNSDLGAAKKINIITVITKDLPDEYFYALEQAWIGSKQNDFVVVINVDASGTITWVNVMAFTTNKLAEIVVRNSILKIGKLDRVAIMASIRKGVQENFIKRQMSDFEYLKNSTTPSKGMWLFSMIFGLILSIGIGIFLMNNNYDNEDENFVIFKQGSERMNALAKVALGLLGITLIMGVVGVGSVIGINNNMVQQEAGLTAQYKQNQNNYDNMVKKVIEVAQVPAMAANDLEKLTKAAIQGRYGAEGSKAVFQFIKEQNPTVSAELYSKIQAVIEAGRNSFEADQKMLLDKKRIYETSLNTFPSGVVAKFLGFPKINLNEIDIVTSDRTEKAFGTKKDEAIKLRQ